MFNNLPKLTFSINLPSSTSREVLEWFEIMENSNILAEAMVELVHNCIQSGKHLKSTPIYAASYENKSASGSGQSVNQDSLFDNLYNWQDSNNAVFKEIKEEKKEKKRMLSV